MELSDREPLLGRLSAASDRVQEAHWFLHGMEGYYHHASPFRWHVNAFLRPLKEVPQVIEMAIQNESKLVAWHRERVEALRADPLIRALGDRRDFVVHRGMLLASSTAMLGITEGRGMKLGIGRPLDPRIDSDAAMQHYVDTMGDHGDLLGIVRIQDEDSMPAIERKWSLEPFEDTELIDLCAEAWLKVANHFGDLLDLIGDEVERPTLDCRHNADAVRIRAYDREALRRGAAEGFSLHPRWAVPMGQFRYSEPVDHPEPDSDA